MDKHKSKALDGGCLCSKCPLRFECFTQERLFSDPIFQGLFEALIAKGYSKEDALNRVFNELMVRIGESGQPDGQPQPWTIYPPNTTIYQPNITCISDTAVDTVKINPDYIVVYTMADGKELTWNADYDGSYKS